MSQIWDIYCKHCLWSIFGPSWCTKSCKTTFYAHLMRIWKLARFTRFIRKVFATKILLSGKFLLFVTLSTGPYWPSTITYQPVPPYTDPLPPRTNQDRPILTHFHHVPTNTAPYWPSITKYQPTPPHTDPLLPQTNQYCLILTKHHQAPFIIISSFRLTSDS